MANLPETPTWEAGIYQFERTDPVEGGPDGIDNTPTKQLANRTAYLKQEVELRAPIASPAFTGNPTAPTQVPGNNSTRLANTAFVQAALAALVASSPAALDTLNELAAALGDDPNFATTVMNALAEKAPLISPALTGNPTAPTQAPGEESTRLATTAFVIGEITNQFIATGKRSLSGGGYQVFPGGLIIQWGSFSAIATGAPVNFPIAFPNAALRVVATDITGEGADIDGTTLRGKVGISTVTATAVTLHGEGSVAWVGIGY